MTDVLGVHFLSDDSCNFIIMLYKHHIHYSFFSFYFYLLLYKLRFVSFTINEHDVDDDDQLSHNRHQLLLTSIDTWAQTETSSQRYCQKLRFHIYFGG